MMTALLFAAFASLAPGTAGTFFQTVEAEFASEAEAARAALVATELPEGKRYAFSTRWDDANPRHDLMSRTLSAIGMPSTFYVNGRPTPAFCAVISNVLARGSSIGSHSISHAYMSRLSSMRFFREVMESRIVLETVAQRAVTTFVLPYSSIGTRADPQCAFRAGRALANAGFLGGAERNPRQAATYGLPSERWVSSNTFSINDRDPDPAQFAAQFKAAKARIDAGNCPCGPHLTLGVHAWQSDEGMKRLADILRPEAGRADTWYCNENDYVAHRVQYLAASVTRCRVQGRRVTWRVGRPEPYVLGAAVPLACALSETPVKVSVDGCPAEARRALALPVPDRHGMPTRYAVRAGGISVEGRTVRARFANETDAPLEDVVMTLRLPPCCATGVLTRTVGCLAPGGETVQTWPIACADHARHATDAFFCAVQTDAIAIDGSRHCRVRFWQSFSREGEAAEENCARDRCRVAGPFANAPIGELIAAAEGRWEKAKREEGAAPYAVSAMRNFKPQKGACVLFAFEFEADTRAHGERWFVRAEIPILFAKSTFRLNGRDVDVSKPVTLREGHNELVVAVPADPGNWGGRLMMSIVSARDGAGVNYRDVE